MSAITFTIGPDGSVEILAMNTREDLGNDFKFFIGQAKTYDPTNLETMFLHQRYLRAALLTLFAYAEAVVNGWLHLYLEDREMLFLFERLQHECLDRKIEILREAAMAEMAKPNVAEARKVRNLLVHFTPGREGEAFEKMSLALVESAASELNRWMTEMESTLGLQRHPDSEQLVRSFANEIGTTTKDVSSDPDK